jgi:GMP synthase (glutamine-hydrolysing)
LPHYLIAESETIGERQERRNSAGKSSAETYAATLMQMQPGCKVTIVAPADDDARIFEPKELCAFEAVFLTGSPLHVYDDTPEVRRQIGFMRKVFASGTPSFGSCAGLQLAVVTAGGKVRQMPNRMEAGISRRICATDDGRDHPLLAGRPASWDAPAIHGDEVEELPPGAILLASNGVTRVQAAEIRYDRGVFWGVQYHPELALGEIAVALKRQADDIVEAGLADTVDDVAARADHFTELHRAPDRRSLRWILGVDGEFADEHRRRTEIRNFLGMTTARKRQPSLSSTGTGLVETADAHLRDG